MAPAGPAALALVGDWALVATGSTDAEDPAVDASFEPTVEPFLRYHANGVGENLNDGECFNWHDDGTFTNANLYRTWQLDGDTLEITSIFGSPMLLHRVP